MKKITYLSAAAGVLIATAIVATSCMEDMELYGPTEQLQPELNVDEARHFFEQYAAENVTTTDLPGMAPGNFAPQWDKAVAATFPHAKESYVDVPIVAERYYTADFAKGNPATGLLALGYYTTAIAQKLVVSKNLKTGALGCAMVTIIPAEKAATKSQERVQSMHIHGRRNIGFSGVVVYASVATNSTYAVDKYVNGKITARESIYNKSQSDGENLTDMRALVGQVGAKARIIAKGLWDDIIEAIFGGGGGGGGNGNTYYGGEIEEIVVIGTRPQPEPDPEPPFVFPPISNSDGSSGSSSGSSGSSGSNNNNNNNNTTPVIDLSRIAPKAAKVFKGVNLSDQNWRDLEEMIVEIEKDCMGGKLYNSLPNNGSINIEYNQGLGDAGVYDHNSTTIIIKDLNGYSDVLFHEMLHYYQMMGKDNTTNTQNLMNYEVESHTLQYLYARKDPAAYFRNKRLRAKYESSAGLGREIDALLSNMDSKGSIITNSSYLNEDYAIVMGNLRNMGYDVGHYPYNPNHSSQSIFQNIMSDC